MLVVVSGAREFKVMRAHGKGHCQVASYYSCPTRPDCELGVDLPQIFQAQARVVPVSMRLLLDWTMNSQPLEDQKCC